MLLDPERDLGLPFLQLARLIVVFVLRNAPKTANAMQHRR
jgi:hypothetical protein